jgi:hypothetical protein
MAGRVSNSRAIRATQGGNRLQEPSSSSCFVLEGVPTGNGLVISCGEGRPEEHGLEMLVRRVLQSMFEQSERDKRQKSDHERVSRTVVKWLPTLERTRFRADNSEFVLCRQLPAARNLGGAGTDSDNSRFRAQTLLVKFRCFRACTLNSETTCDFPAFRHDERIYTQAVGKLRGSVEFY